ncbi:hypothetical protein P7D63_11465 [Enterococcus raffinosus]|uniref:hypothetical protein n=1 Tax=Enterococcus raffinosus TaxID=71452 RepID=UPI00288CFDDC|nr:hypothetical protein [Enterococcus raffinosus]MDT2555307.1 hypothetical protein [Enterococcus raffinosus]
MEESENTKEDTIFDKLKAYILPAIEPLSISWSSPSSVNHSKGGYISGYFKNWSVYGTVSVDDWTAKMQIAYNFDMILAQCQKSFSALEKNESKIATEMYHLNDAVNGRVDRINTRLETAEGSISNVQTSLNNAGSKINELYQLHNLQEASLESKAAKINELYRFHNSQQGSIDSHDAKINQLYQLRNEHQKILERHSESLNSAGEKINQLYSLNNDQGVVLGKHTASINQLYQLRDEHQKVLERHSASLNSAGEKIDELYQLNSDQGVVLGRHTASINQLYQLHNTQQESLDSHSALLTSHSASILQLYQLHNAQQESIDLLKTELLGVIAAIVKASSDNVGLWDAEHYDGGSVSEGDGKAVRLFKNQFQGLKTHYAAIMRTYFDMDDKESAIYRLRYSIVAGFEETKDLLSEWFTTLLESQNTMNKFLKVITDWLQIQNNQLNTVHDDLVSLLASQNTINTNLSSIISYLALQEEHFKTCEIYFQFIISWLADIFDKIGSEDNGGWIKELIKTLGSLLETAIKTLGTLLETAIREVSDLLKKLLNFLDGLIDDLLHLIVPENLDFMDHKFDSTSKTIKLKFGSIFDGIDSFKSMFGSKSVFEDIEINLGGFGKGSFKIPVSILNNIAPFVQPLITGAVALEFLIDMYKWFHTKGEVIE